ncbi:MAG: DUF1127 domain-containing protein [Devosia sp.]
MTTEPKTSQNTSFIITLLRRIASGLREARVRRNRRLALATLMSMPEARLDDLGINRQDIVEAFTAPRSATPSLETLRDADRPANSDSTSLCAQACDIDLGVMAIGARPQPHRLAI